MLLEPPQPSHHGHCLLLIWLGPPGKKGDFAGQENPCCSGSPAGVVSPCWWVKRGREVSEGGELKSAADDKKFILTGEASA